MAVFIRVPELPKLSRSLQQLASDLGPDRVLKACGTQALAATQKRFARTKQGPDGKAWPAAKTPPVGSKGQTKGTTLYRTGTLARSVRMHAVPGVPQVAVGTSDKRGAVHQFGHTVLPKKGKALAIPQADGSVRVVRKAVIPARPFLGWTPEDERAVVRTVTAPIRKFGARA